MVEIAPMLEILFICRKSPFPKDSLDKLTSVLAMYGYSLLGSHALSEEQSADIPAPGDYPCKLALVVQNLLPHISDSYGEPLNTNLFRAVKGVTRKFKDLDLFVVSPGSVEEHDRQLRLMNFPDLEELSALAHANSGSFNPPFPSLECISNSNSRTRIDKIRFGEGMAVCKTFRSTNLAALKKEITARKVLGKNVPEIAPLLDYGDNYFIMPYYEPAWTWQPDSIQLFPLRYAEKCLEIMQRIHRQGWSVIDWHPGNFIYLSDDKVVMVDLEALTQNTERKPFENSADILGHEGFPYQDKPINYVNTWQPIVGLSLKSLLYGSPGMKRFRRALFFLGKALPSRVLKKTEQALRKPIRQVISRRQIRRRGRFLIYRY